MTNATSPPTWAATFLKLALVSVLAACGGSIDTTTGSPSGEHATATTAPLTGPTGGNGAFLAYGGKPDSSGNTYCVTAPATITEGALATIAPCSEPLGPTQSLFTLVGTDHPGFSSKQNVVTNAASGAWKLAIDYTCTPNGINCTESFGNVFFTHTSTTTQRFTVREEVLTIGGTIKFPGRFGAICIRAATNTIGAQSSITAGACDGSIGTAWQGERWLTAIKQPDSFTNPAGFAYCLTVGTPTQGGAPQFNGCDNGFDSNGFGLPGAGQTWDAWSNFYSIPSGGILSTAGLAISPDGSSTWWLEPRVAGIQYQNGLDVNGAWITVVGPNGWTGIQTMANFGSGNMCLQNPLGSNVDLYAPCLTWNAYQDWYMVYQ